MDAQILLTVIFLVGGYLELTCNGELIELTDYNTMKDIQTILKYQGMQIKQLQLQNRVMAKRQLQQGEKHDRQLKNLQNIVSNLVTENKILKNKLKIETDNLDYLRSEVKSYMAVKEIKNAPFRQNPNASDLRKPSFNSSSSLIREREAADVLNDVVYEANESETPHANKENMRLIRLSSGDSVAFYAYLSHKEPNPSANHLLVFNSVKTNIGNAYNRHSGMFTAPSSGIYVFTFTIYTGGHGQTYFNLIVNDAVYATQYGETVGVSNIYDSDSHTIVVMLNQGDDVYVRSYMACTTDVLGSLSFYTTSFAGWKLS